MAAKKGGGLKDRVDAAAAGQALASTRPTSTVLSIFQDATIKTQLAAAIGSSSALSAERLLVVALNECRRNPQLLECTRESFVGALLTAAHLGLEVGGPLGHFYLVPFMNNQRTPKVREVVPILGYKGIIVLARRGGEVEDVVARPVHANDRFDFAYGIEDKLVHVPADGERGPIVRFYGIARFTNGGHLVLVMSKPEVDAFRGRSRAAAADSGPWTSDYAPMGSKTVIRRMAPYLPLSTESATAIAEDEERELGLTPEGVLDLEALGFPNGKPAAGTPPAATEAAKDPGKEQGGRGEQPSDAGGAEGAGASVGNPAAVATTSASPAPDPVVCGICGATDANGPLVHDDAKHAAWSAAKRAEKETVVPEAASKPEAKPEPADDPGAAFRPGA